MALSDITNKIHADAEKKQGETIQRAKKLIEQRELESRQECERITREFDQETERLLEKNKQKVTIGAQQESKMYIDSVKRSLIDKVFEDALEKMCISSDDTYSSLLKSLLKNIPKDTHGILKTPENRKKVTQVLVSQTHPHLTLEVDNSIRGGCVIVGDSFEYDLTFTSLVEDKKDELEIEVSQFLFS